MNDRLFSSFCKVGEAADELYREGRHHDAHDGYTRLLLEIEGSGLVDSYLLSKITLGILLTKIRSGQFQDAFAIWNSNLEESLFGIGIYGLEHAQTSVHDMITYDFICAYLHSLSEASSDSSASAINQYMSRICEHFQDMGDRENMKIAISNWKQHLREVFGSAIPQVYASPLIAAERSYGGSIPPQGISFPMPSPWARPEGFREMSRLIKFEPLEFRAASGQGRPTAAKRK